MRILYYCPEYYSQHGGRTHARGFYAALKELPEVSDTCLYPEDDPGPPLKGDESGGASSGRLWFLPQVLRKILRFFRPRPGLDREITDIIKEKRCNALVVRTGVIQPSFRQIRKYCPDTIICAEVNSAYFDEEFSGVPFRSILQKREAMRFDEAHVITVVSSQLKSYLEGQGISSDKIMINQNGVDITAVTCSEPRDVRAEYQIPEDGFVIGYIGGMEAFRRLPEVIRYMAAIREAGHDDIYFIIVGDGTDMSAVRKEIEKHKHQLQDTVILTGWLDHAEIPAFLKAFDMAVFPFTNAYCSPLKLFEYLAAGLPVIGPDTSAVREIFDDGVHLALVRQDGKDFIDTVVKLKNNPQLRHEMGRQGQKLVKEKYTWKQNAENVVRLLERCRQQLAS